MHSEPPQPSTTFAADVLPRSVFVFGKGGTGRSTVAAALALACAERGERVLVLEWAIEDPIGPWFGKEPAGPRPVTVAPRLAVANFTLVDALEQYFVDHLRLGTLFRSVIRSPSVAGMLDIAPGLAEMFFLGEVWWLLSLAKREAGLAFDRIIVDAPATGHGTSLLDVPATLARMPAAGLLAAETRRVTGMLRDPARVGSIVVSLPEPLVVDETLELIPRLPRPPLAVVINRSTAGLAALPERDPIADEIRARNDVELELRARIVASAVAVAEQPGASPISVVRLAAHALEAA